MIVNFWLALDESAKASIKTTPAELALVYSKEKPIDYISAQEFHQRAGKATTTFHAIPHRTIFIHTLHQDPKDLPPLIYDNMMNTHTIFSEHWKNQTKEEDPPMWFLRDQDCLLAIKLAEPRLLPYYRNEVRGNNKANICRVAALYVKGGYYFDVDMKTIRAVALPNTVDFATPQEVYGEDLEGVRGLFNSFLAAAPKHAILKQNLQLYLDHYRGIELPVKSKNHHLGTGSLRLAYDQTPKDQRGTPFLELEEFGRDDLLKYNLIPQRGKGCCCNYFVGNPSDHVPYFWSRFVGSGVNCAIKGKDDRWDDDFYIDGSNSFSGDTDK